MAFYHKDCAVQFHGDTKPIGKSTIKDTRARLLKSVELEPLGVRIIGNVAVTHYYYKGIGQYHNYVGRATRTWMKQNGKWQIIGGMNSDCKRLPPCLWP